MKLPVFITAIVVCACACRGNEELVANGQERKAGEIVLSSNDLRRILLDSANVACAASAESLYKKHTVFLSPKGNLKARFDIVSVFSTKYELVSKLAECLIDCPVKMRKQPDGSYLYTNKAKHVFRIQVIHDECDQTHFQGVYYITGERFFAKLRALLRLESRPAPGGGIQYAVNLYGGSDSFVFNIFGRAWFVKNYLSEEVDTIVAKFDAVYDEMLNDPRAKLQKLTQCKDSMGSPYFSDEEIGIATKFAERLLRESQEFESSAVP